MLTLCRRCPGCRIRSNAADDDHSNEDVSLTPEQRLDLDLMQSLAPRPEHIPPREWNDLLLLEAPSVLGLASSSANRLDDEDFNSADLRSSSAADSSGSSQRRLPSPVNSSDSSDTCDTSMPYSPSASEASQGSAINVETSGLATLQLQVVAHPAEIRSRELLQLGAVTGRSMSLLLDLLPHAGRPIQQVPGHGYTQQPRHFSSGAYAHGPNAGLLRSTQDFPYTSLLLARIIRSCAPEHTFSSLSLTRNLMSRMHRDSYISRRSPNILIPLSRFAQGGLWVEDAQGEVVLEQAGPAGREVPLQRPYTCLWSHLRHATLPWRGDRLILIGYHIGQASRLTAGDRRRLADLGFYLEGSQV